MFPGTIIEFIVAVTIALMTRSLWALVLGYLSGHATRTFTPFLIGGKVPGFRINMEIARSLVGYGKWIWGSSIIVCLIMLGDDIYVGKVLGAAALGIYQVAYYLSNTPQRKSPISFPR
ncbi:MAG TPA: oligosaccharide flippase family protein [Thermoanaerobaculia bacterium]|nr:oligosaccharide flippase family protein [Thermoanaerobaculia bacterium]HUM30058.1 oligosaccharide flippase family protein [Thermoanaerobaculia bacterium]HXK69446.1 oligosaccharide flippase family protein [Thermoanaerobaculia bacterium]